MLFSVTKLRKHWNINPIGVLHVGAHEAEEAKDYERENWLPVIWVEGQSLLADKIKETLDPKFHTVIQAFVWDASDEVLKFKQTNNSQSSSLLDFGTHATDYPNVNVQEEYFVRTSRLDEKLPNLSQFDFINLDLQGVELQALKGLGLHVEKAKWIYTEVNKKDVYMHCTLIGDLDQYLENFKFRRVATRWVFGKGWGDALYVRSDIRLPITHLLSRIWLKINWQMSSVITITKNIIRELLERMRIVDAS